MLLPKNPEQRSGKARGHHHAETSGSLLDLEDRSTCSIVCSWAARCCCFWANRGSRRQASDLAMGMQFAAVAEGANVAPPFGANDALYRSPSSDLYTHQQNPRGAKDITPHASAPVSPRETQSHGIPGEKSKPKPKAHLHTSVHACCAHLHDTPARLLSPPLHACCSHLLLR